MAKNIADGDIIWTQRKRNWCRTPFTFTTYTLTADELATQSGLRIRASTPSSCSASSTSRSRARCCSASSA